MPVPEWDVPNNYYDSDMKEPLAEERIPMTTARDKALEEKPWKCSGCGAVAPDRVEACDCPTISLYRWSGEYMEHAIKKGRESPREKLARWMIENSIATGHGDTFDDLLAELAGYVRELRALKEEA